MPYPFVAQILYRYRTKMPNIEQKLPLKSVNFQDKQNCHIKFNSLPCAKIWETQKLKMTAAAKQFAVFPVAPIFFKYIIHTRKYTKTQTLSQVTQKIQFPKST